MAKKLDFNEIARTLASKSGIASSKQKGAKKALAVFEKRRRGRGKDKTRPEIIQTDDEILEEVQTKELQSEEFVVLPEMMSEHPRNETEIVSVGRMLRVIPSSSYGPSREYYEKNSAPENNETFVRDALRGRVGSYWTIDSKQKQFEFINATQASAPYVINYRAPVDIDTASDFGITEEWVDISSTKGAFNNAEKKHSKQFWKSYVSGGRYNGSTTKRATIAEDLKATIDKNTFYFDHAYEMPLPFSREELEKMNVPQAGLSAEVAAEYNFFAEVFEKKISEDGVLENTLPNMYAFLSELTSENPNPDFRELITLSDTIKVEDGLFTKKEGQQKFDIKTHPIGQYYDLYARQYNNAPRTVIEDLRQKFSNVLLPIGESEMLKKFNDKREMFPMYVDVQFSTDKTTTFAQVLKDTNLSDSFVAQMAKLISGKDSFTESCQQSEETIIQKLGNGNPKKVAAFSDVTKRAWDLTTVLAPMETGTGISGEDSVLLGKYENRRKHLDGKESKFFKSLMFTIFYGKLQRLIRQKFRTFESLLEGRLAYSETVLYRVAKYEGDVSGKLLQNHYFPNSNEIDVLRFIDTQVKYNKKYTYVVYAYQLVIGNKYRYDKPDVDSYVRHATFKVEQQPSIRLYENKYYTFNSVVVDDPPIMPDINIIPYKNIDNKLLFLMNGNVGNIMANPITINHGEEKYFNNLRKQRGVALGAPIRFKADDQSTSFEVYRTDIHPTSYRDFAGNLLASIRTDIDFKTLQSATAASYVDTLIPNKKYYYTFRAFDSHNNFSNPTPIIKVELINEGGTIFLLKEVVEFSTQERTATKQMRRYIQLVPNVLQTLIDEEKSGFDGAKSATELKSKLHLGVVDDKVWEKDFVVRLTSRSTGKKIDFKVRFAHKHEEKIK